MEAMHEMKEAAKKLGEAQTSGEKQQDQANGIDQQIATLLGEIQKLEATHTHHRRVNLLTERSRSLIGASQLTICVEQRKSPSTRGPVAAESTISYIVLIDACPNDLAMHALLEEPALQQGMQSSLSQTKTDCALLLSIDGPCIRSNLIESAGLG